MDYVELHAHSCFSLLDGASSPEALVARAALLGSYLARIEDVEALAEPVLSHRILTSFHAESEGITSRDIIMRLLEEMRKSEQ